MDPLLLEKTCLVAVVQCLLLELFGSCKLRKAGRPCAAAAANPAQSAPRRCRRHCRRPCYCLTALYCSAVKQYTEALLYVVASKQAAYPTSTNGLQDSRTAAAMRRRRIAHVACGVASTFLAVAQCLHLNTTLSARPSPRRRVWRHAAVAPSCAPPATRA